MKAIEELYYLLGRLESLKMKNEVRVEELSFARNILEKNQFFKETDDYWYGFWKVKDTYEEAKELIIDLCKALNKLQP